MRGNFDREAQALVNMQKGMELAHAAIERGDQRAAWQYVLDYNLSEIEVLELGLSEKYRPRSLRGREFPKAMGS